MPYGREIGFFKAEKTIASNIAFQVNKLNCETAILELRIMNDWIE